MPEDKRPPQGRNKVRLTQPDLPDGEVATLLATAPITGFGLHPLGSNHVFVVKLESAGGDPLYGIYKPQAGERPLRDFPRGTLYRRECAAYELSVALGWPAIPPTVIREGPHGVGSVQLFIDADPAANFFTMRESELPAFEPVAAFDFLANNADRKAGACLKDRAGKVWAIDQGLTFNPYALQRTVMWEFCGERIADRLVEDMKRVVPELDPRARLGCRLEELLVKGERHALCERLERIIAEPVFPVLDPNYNVPWPLV
ncbi:MAG: hypothetical protein HYY34_03965 [Chloroflexi bacterium]|nr:hypothetical protein [Chloroflexota bacterium]